MSIEEYRRHIAEALEDLDDVEAVQGLRTSRIRSVLESKKKAAELPTGAITTEDRQLLQAIGSALYANTPYGSLVRALEVHEKRFGKLNTGA